MDIQEKIRLMLVALQLRKLGYSEKYINKVLEVYE